MSEIRVYVGEDHELYTDQTVYLGDDCLIVDGAMKWASVPSFIKDKLSTALEAKVKKAWPASVLLELLDVPKSLEGVELEVYEFNVAGVTFDGRQPALQNLHKVRLEGKTINIECEKEPDNQYDKNAVKVIWKQAMSTEVHVGYVPKGDAADMAEMFARGGKIVEAKLLDSGVMDKTGIIWLKAHAVLSKDV